MSTSCTEWETVTEQINFATLKHEPCNKGETRSEGCIVTTKITRNIIEAFLDCKYEGHLKLTGQMGVQSDYQTLLTTSRDAVRRSAFDRISAGHACGEDVQQGIAWIEQTRSASYV